MRAAWRRASGLARGATWAAGPAELGRSRAAAAGSAPGARRCWPALGTAVAGAGASACALVLAEGPVLAKQHQQTRQEVYVWGRVQSIPGGAPGDVLWPKRIEWFERNEAGWAKISFGPSFGAAVDRAGRLYVWGEGEEDFVGPVAAQVLGEAKGRHFVDAQCSSDKIFGLTKTGETFIFEDILGTLRQFSSGSETQAASLRLPGRRVPGLPQPGVFSRLWGGGVKQMGIGLEHGAFVTHSGELFCVGGNEWGQCGVSPPQQKGPMGALEERSRVEVLLPVKVAFPEEAGPIVSVAVGGRHTVAMDKSGRVFSFGDDRRIQLGLGDTRTRGTDERNSYGVIRQEQLGGRETKLDINRAVTYRYYDPHMQSKPVPTLPPTVYNRPPYPPPSFVACGEDFTIAMHRDSPDWFSKDQETNLLLCAGENGEGQCGRGLQEQQQSWQAVRLPKRSRTERVACGQSHCIAALASGDVYAWGASHQGQLGNGKRALKSKPVRIGLQPSEAAPAKPKNVSSPGMPAEYVAQAPDFRPFPGRVVELTCGFRNSAVICEVPVAA